MPTHQQPNAGAVPTSSGRNRFATRRTLAIFTAVLALVGLFLLYGLGLGAVG